jgi:hypothetical protein
MRRRRPGSRSKRYKRRLPGVLGWSLGVRVGLAALVAIAYVRGNAPDGDDDFLASLHTTLAKPAVAGAVAFAAVLVLAWGVRHLLLEFPAWWPGRIIVGEFVAGPGVEGADVARLTGRVSGAPRPVPPPVPGARAGAGTAGRLPRRPDQRHRGPGQPAGQSVERPSSGQSPRTPTR